MVSIAVLLIAVGFWFILAFFLERLRAHKYSTFPTTGGVIDSLDLIPKKGVTRTPTWTPSIIYTYKVDETVFTGTRLTFTRVVVEEKTAGKIRDLFKIGNPVKVYFNPRKPADSVLNPKGADLNNRLILGVVLTLTGIALGLLTITPTG